MLSNVQQTRNTLIEKYGSERIREDDQIEKELGELTNQIDALTPEQRVAYAVLYEKFYVKNFWIRYAYRTGSVK